MICVIALVVFAVMAIFSASYRPLAKEAFDCVFRKVTFRKCHTGLDKRLKSGITGKLMRTHPRLGVFTYKHFEIISTIFTIILIASLVYTAYGGYNFVIWGNCNGSNSDGFCVFDPIDSTSEHLSEQESAYCASPEFMTPEYITKPDVSSELYLGKSDATVTVIEFGCYTCQYTKEVQPVIEDFVQDHKDKIKFVFLPFPILTHENSMQSTKAVFCAEDQGKFFEYHDKLFEEGPNSFEDHARELSLNITQFNECIGSNSTQERVEEYLKLGKESGVYGTPTIFINDRLFVGPQKPRVLKRVMYQELGDNVIIAMVKSWV